MVELLIMICYQLFEIADKRKGITKGTRKKDEKGGGGWIHDLHERYTKGEENEKRESFPSSAIYIVIHKFRKHLFILYEQKYNFIFILFC